jgi:hypothetical protein
MKTTYAPLFVALLGCSTPSSSDSGADAITTPTSDATTDGTGTGDGSATTPDAAVPTGTRIGMNPGAGSTAADITTWGGYTSQLHATAIRLFFPIYTWTPSGDNAPFYWGDNITNIKNQIDGYTAAGFRVTVTMAAGPCSSTHACPNIPAATGKMRADNTPANDFDGFLDTFVAAIGQTTFDKVAAVEVWNEWDNAGNGQPYGYMNGSASSMYTAAQVVDDLLHAGSVTLKKYNPNVEIIAGAVITNHEADIAALVTAGAAKYVDAFSYHPYYSTLANLTKGLAAAQAGVPAGKRLTLTEWGCNAGTYDAPATAASAIVLTDSFAVLRAAGLEEADYYVMNSSQFSAPDQKAYGLVSVTYTGGGPTLGISASAPQPPLFAAFGSGAAQ